MSICCREVYSRSGNLMTYVNFTTSKVLGCWAAFAHDFKLSECYPRNKLNDKEKSMRKLRQDLIHVAETNRRWNIKLNPAKCMVIRFGELVDDNSGFTRIFGERLQFVRESSSLTKVT